MEAASTDSQESGGLFFAFPFSNRAFIKRPQLLGELSSELFVFLSSLHNVLD